MDRWYVNNDVDPIDYLHILVNIAIRAISALTLERECTVGTKTNEFNQLRQKKRVFFTTTAFPKR